MDIKLIIFYSIIFLIGYSLLIFNKEIGDLAEKNFRNMFGQTVGKYVIWFPRVNAVVIGSLFVLGGLLNLIDVVK
jgi:hypothetical protein